MADYAAPTEDLGYDPRKALHEVLEFAERFVAETPGRGDLRSWAGARAERLIALASAAFLAGGPFGRPFEAFHQAVEATPPDRLETVGLTPPQLTLKLVAVEAANRRGREDWRGIGLVYKFVKSLIDSLIEGGSDYLPPWVRAMADAFGELSDNIQDLVEANRG